MLGHVRIHKKPGWVRIQAAPGAVDLHGGISRQCPTWARGADFNRAARRFGTDWVVPVGYGAKILVAEHPLRIRRLVNRKSWTVWARPNRGGVGLHLQPDQRCGVC